MTRNSTFISLVLLCTIVITACASATPSSTTSTTDTSSSQVAQPNSTGAAKVNLNTASSDDFLAAVPGLGNRMVREFMEYRPYISIRQFHQEIGNT